LTSSELREPAACDIVDDEPTLTDIPELINDTQPQLEALSNAVDELLATNSRDQSHRDEPAQANGGADDDESFDLDAALSPDVESTNMMPGITTNLDDIVAAGDAAGRNSPDAAALADLPTLSDSMRVDVKKAARQAADAVEEPVATSATVPAIEPEPAADATADSAPVAAAEDEHPANPEGDSELALEPAVTQDGSPHAESVDNALDDTSGAELEPEPALEFDPDFALENLPADEPEPTAAGAVETDNTGGGEDEVAALSVDTDDAPVMPEPTGHEPDLASDLDALEAALQSAKQGELAVAPQPAINGAAPVDVAPDATPEAAPEITLDRALEEQQVQSRKLADVSSAIGGVNSLEDIDDLTAETLFGEEFAAIADSVVAEGQLVDPNAADAPEAEPAATEAVTADACNDDAADAAPSSGANTATANGSSGESELRQSVAMRIDVLNEMKAKIATEHTEVVELGEEPARSPHRGPQPEPIERQINTSMTQTLQALKVSQAADAVADARSKKKSGGLFARFRRSS
jgi:hypothetical protein